MLETLVSSRIRRTLFEYLLSHSHDRFYLRGLAKELSLSISPLRRELKRLERSGMLQAVQEGNMRFYTVNVSCAAFLQLKQAGLPVSAMPAPALAGPAAEPQGPFTSIASSRVTQAVAASAGPAVTALRAPLRQSPLSSPALIGAAAVGVALLLTVAGLLYLTVTNQRAATEASRALAVRKVESPAVSPQPAASGTMHGARWRVVPGGFGGFSANADSESY